LLLDTNILIYSARPGGENMRPWLDDASAVVSIVSRIEALGFPRLGIFEKTALESALQTLPEVGLTESIAIRAITLRQDRKMGLADAIIAATA